MRNRKINSSNDTKTVIGVVLLILFVAVSCAVINEKYETKQFESCSAPRVLYSIPTYDSKNRQDGVKYLYECGDGSQIESSWSPSRVKRFKAEHPDRSPGDFNE